MAPKTDLRVLKTHKALKETMLRLMNQKRFEEITVHELCEEAMVRRATFYKYFGDKYEFFGFVIRELQADCDSKDSTSADYLNGTAFFTTIMNHLLKFLGENERLVQNVLGSNMLSTLMDILSEQITSDLMAKMKTAAKDGLVLPASPEIMASFFAGAIMQTARWWLMQKNQIPEEQLIQEMERILLAWK